MDIEWNKSNIAKASAAGAILVIAVVLLARAFLGGPKVEVNESAAEQRSEAPLQGGSRWTSPEDN